MAKQIWKPGNLIYPLPAVMVSCGDATTSNIITIGWTGTINTNPPKTYVSIRPTRHSYDIIKSTGEFVINLTTLDLAKATDFCGVRSGRNVNKFEHCNLTATTSNVVNCPSIGESPVNIECKVYDIQELGSHHMFLSDVVSVTIDDTYLSETGKLQLEKTKPICYSHGAYYEVGDFIGQFGYSVMKEKTKKKLKKNLNKKPKK